MNPTYIGVGITIFIVGFNAAMFAVIKFNDMVHIAKDLSEIKGDVKELVKNQAELNTRLVKQETKCNERHSRKRNKLS